MISRSVSVTSLSRRWVFIVYSPLFAGTYSCNPTYSTSKTGFLPNAVRNSLAVLKVRKGGVTASITPYSGTKTEIRIGISTLENQDKEICHKSPLICRFYNPHPL